MTDSKMARDRILVVGARSAADVISAGNVAEAFSRRLDIGECKPGWRNGAIYVRQSAACGKRQFYVWATATRITVDFREHGT